MAGLGPGNTMNMGNMGDMAGMASVPQLDVDMDLSELAQMQFSAHPSMLAPPTTGEASSYALSPDDNSAMPGTGTGAGAGPLPVNYGTQNANAPGSTLTEFTKRRNWSQRVLEELRDFLHILTPDGRFLYASPSVKALTGWEPSQLISRSVTDFIHPEDGHIYLQEFNESIASGNPLRFFYRFRKTDDSWVIFESHGHPHLGSNPTQPYNGTLTCRGFFMMARPYPTKNAALLDSFLEHKIENVRLQKRIADLKEEEARELAEEDSQWRSRADTYSSIAPSETVGQTESEGGAAAAAYNAMPPPAKPGISNTALTRQNLNEALAASKPDSIADKMHRYEGSTQGGDPIALFTGLDFAHGERAQGLSTGDASPMLIRGDAGIQIPLDRDARSSDKKKKMKIADEYVCTDCGTLDSPEWRKGPQGPKTLCNACGCECHDSVMFQAALIW
jgi:PAS domain S-box-containing protein